MPVVILYAGGKEICRSEGESPCALPADWNPHSLHNGARISFYDAAGRLWHTGLMYLMPHVDRRIEQTTCAIQLNPLGEEGLKSNPLGQGGPTLASEYSPIHDVFVREAQLHWQFDTSRWKQLEAFAP